MIKININLSTRPFVNNRKFFLITALLLLILCGISFLSSSLYRSYQGRNAEVKAVLARDQLQIQRLGKEQEQIRSRLQTPDNEEFLDLIDYINLRIKQRTFSWTQLLNDLEQLVPPNLQIASIRPQIVENEVAIEISANGRSSEDYIQFISNLESSGKFLSVTPLSEDVAKTPGLLGKQVTIRVKYTGQS